MTKFYKERWKKLAGIITESSYRFTQNDFLKQIVNKHVLSIIKELNVDKQDMPVIYDVLTNMLQDYLSSATFKSFDNHLKEKMSPETLQDLKAYLGTNDSVDGPYTELSDVQPMNCNPKKRANLNKKDKK